MISLENKKSIYNQKERVHNRSNLAILRNSYGDQRL